MNPAPTPYSDVNEILQRLHTEITAILKDQLVGMFLFGSLANGDFDQHSDIDVLVVTAHEISKDEFSALRDMHLEIAKLNSPWAVQQEVSYMPRTALRRYEPPNIHHPYLDRGEGETLHTRPHASDWIIQRHLLRERGIVIVGPDLKTLIDPVTPQEIRQAVIDVLPLWIDPILNDPTKISGRGYQSFCVLSLCRMLYTLQNKAILSKPAAAQWAIANLDSKWAPLIKRAIIGRQNPTLNAELEDNTATLEMMRYVSECTQQPSIYPDVNQLLKQLLQSTKEVLQAQFIGMYLYGSLSSGDFNPETSDIDYLIITNDILTDEMISKLKAMHDATWAISLKRAGELEGAYVPKDLIRKHDPNGVPCPIINEGKFLVAPLGSDWIIQRHVVREYGISVEGPDPKSLIDFVSPDDIRSAVMSILHEWWFPMLNDPSWLRDHDSGYHSFAILSMCRALHALEHGTIVSKPAAAKWAQGRFRQRWSDIIELALHSQKTTMDRFDLLDPALEFIRYVKDNHS